jgi:hypothetical protein
MEGVLKAVCKAALQYLADISTPAEWLCVPAHTHTCSKATLLGRRTTYVLCCHVISILLL